MSRLAIISCKLRPACCTISFDAVLASHRMGNLLIKVVGLDHMHQSERSVTSPRQHHRGFQGRFPSSPEVVSHYNSFQLTHGVLSHTARNPQRPISFHTTARFSHLRR